MPFLAVTSTGDLAGDALAAEQATRAATRAAGRVVGADARRFVLADVRRSRGSLRMFTGRLSVRVTVDASAAAAVVTLSPTPVGGWAIIDAGARPHRIRARRRKVLAGGDGVTYGTEADHPGTRGRRYWTNAVGRLDEHLEDTVADVYDPILGG